MINFGTPKFLTPAAPLLGPYAESYERRTKRTVGNSNSELASAVTDGTAMLHASPRHSQYDSLTRLVPVRATQPSSGRPPVAHDLTMR